MRTTTRTRPWAVAAACLALLATAACGSAPGGGPAARAGAVAPAATPPFPGTQGEAAPTPLQCGDPRASLRPKAPIGTPGSPLSATDFPSVRLIQERGHLVVGIDQSTYPFGYIDPVSNTLKGFDIDLLREIARSIFGGTDPDQHLRFRVLRNDQRAPAVARGDVDLVAQTMTVNCERRQQVDFSSVYFVTGQRVLVQKDPKDPGRSARFQGDNPDLTGLRVCAVPGSTSYRRIQENLPGTTAVAGETWADCLVKLQQGDTDAISTDDTILTGLQAQDPYFTEILRPRLSEEPYAVAVGRQRPDLVRYVNSVLERMRAGAWQDLYRKHLGGTPPEPPQPVYRD